MSIAGPDCAPPDCGDYCTCRAGRREAALLFGRRQECLQRPATRVGRTVIHQGGAITRLSLLGWALCALGWKKTVKTP